LGLVKTINSRSIEVVEHNATTKYAVLFVLLCAVSIGISRSAHLGNAIGLLNDMFVSDNWVN